MVNTKCYPALIIAVQWLTCKKKWLVSCIYATQVSRKEIMSKGKGNILSVAMRGKKTMNKHSQGLLIVLSRYLIDFQDPFNSTMGQLAEEMGCRKDILKILINCNNFCINTKF